jgi:hypothetical protein
MEKNHLMCDLCNKNFSSKECLNLHIKTKSCSNKLKNNKKEFKCQYCEKILSTKQMLTYHIESCDKKKLFYIKREYDTMIKELTDDFLNKEKEYLHKISNLESRLDYLNNSSTFINLTDFIVPLNNIKEKICIKNTENINPASSSIYSNSSNSSVISMNSKKMNNNDKNSLENPLIKRRVSF